MESDGQAGLSGRTGKMHMNYQSEDPRNAGIDGAMPVSRTGERDASGRTPADAVQRRRTVMSTINWVFKLVLPFVVIAAGAFASWTLVNSKPEVHRQPPQENSYAVEVIKAEPKLWQPDITLYGTVQAARSVDLRALVSGEVIWVNPDLVEGAFVTGDDPLLRIDPFDYEGGVREAEADLKEARARLAETEASIASEEIALTRLREQETIAINDLERARTLVDSGSLTRQALETRELTLSQRQQAVEARETNLDVLRTRIDQQQANIDRLEWRLEQARRNLENTTLKAPFAGVVKTKNVELGHSVSGNDTLVSLYDPDQMDARFTLSDTQYGRLTADGAELIGRPITVNWKLGARTVSHKASITRITPEVNAANGGVEVFAGLEAGSALRSGTFVELKVPDRRYDAAMEVPQAALYNGNRIYLNEDGRMAPRDVVVLAYLGDTVLIDGADFEPGTEIVTTRVAEAGPGLKLNIAGRSQDGDAAETEPSPSDEDDAEPAQ